MDVTASNVPLNLESIAASLMVNEREPPAKKQRFGEEMNRVAEIVLVLSALGRRRGGENPTEGEIELMLEARSKLADMCQEFTPKDIISGDDIRAVIEDLGLNQRLGFQAPKLTISEKLSLGKRKMEEAKKYATPLVPNGYASTGLGTSVRVSTNYHQPLSSCTSFNTNGSHSRPQTMLNGASQGTANFYAASWSAQPQSTISFSNAPVKKVAAVQSSVRGADPGFRPFMSQTPHGTFPGTNQPMQGMHYGQTSSFGDNHAEIGKIIFKVLHPRPKQYPQWNPPSRDYMSRAMTCQMCEVTINEVETLLICDACEEACHLKCLEANNVKGVPKSEWHCSRCVQESNGKPFPPQYGRAISTSTARKLSSTDGVPSSAAAKKVGSINPQKPLVTTSPGVQKYPCFVSGAATTSHFEPASVNANTPASATKTTGTTSPAPVSLTETPNPTAVASTRAVINNGLISKPLTPVGTLSSTSPLPIDNQVPVNATSNATPASLVAQPPTVTKNGDSSSTISGTADQSILNSDLTTQVHALTVTSSSNSQLAVSHLNADDRPRAPIENVAWCENPSESASLSDSLNDKKTSENGQESNKDAMEDKSASETCQNNPAESPAAVISDQETKITAKQSTPQDSSAYQTEKTASQPPLVSSNFHSQTEKETPNVQDSSQNAAGDSQEGKGLNGLDDRHKEQPSEHEFDNSDSIKEANPAQ